MFFSKIRERINYFIAHRFVKNFAILQTGNIIGNITQALVGILFARILQPELYGVYALAFSLAGLISIFLGVGAQEAVITIVSGAYAKKDGGQIREALAFLLKVTFLTATLSLIGAIAAPLLAKFFYGDPKIGIYAGIVVLASIVSTTMYSLTIIILQVTGRMKSMTVLGLIDQLTRTLVALALVLLGFKVLGIALGHLVGSLVVFTVSLAVWRRTKAEFSIIPTFRSILAHTYHVSIKKYLGFSFWVALDRNLSNLYNILPIFLSGIFIAPGKVTFFKLAFGYINLALSFLGPIGTLLNVEFPKMNIERPASLKRNFIRVSLYSFSISSGISILAALVSPIAFKILYGESFIESTHYVLGLVPYGIVMGLGIGLGSILRALDKVPFSIKLHMVTLAVGVPLGILFIRSWGLWGSVAIVTLWYATIHIVAFSYVIKVLQQKEHEGISETQ